MRAPTILAVFLALLAVVPLLAPTAGAAAAAAPSPAFGVDGQPRFDAYPIPTTIKGPGALRGNSAHGAGEPSIGIPWDTDHAFFQAFANTYRAVFDDANPVNGRPAVTWSDVSPPFTATNVDPILEVDAVGGRIFAGGLDGACSVLGVSDDDGATWTPTANLCNFVQFDHETIGAGAWSTSAPDTPARTAVAPRAAYYCSQLELLTAPVSGLPDIQKGGPGTACTTSLDGGVAWLPFSEVTGGCGGLHGHIKVSEATGTAVVPDGSCYSAEGTPHIGFGITTDNGVTWTSRSMPQSTTGHGFDPAVGFSHQSGWLWLAQADDLGIHVALSKNEGQTWEPIGSGTPGGAATWLDLAPTFADPRTGAPLKFGTFMDVAAGDDARVALTYLATTNPDGKDPFAPPTTGGDPTGQVPSTCGDSSDGNIWHYYLSQSFDGGRTWTTTRLSEDPVQVGAIWNGGGGADCRNLLDFDDMDLDSHGRVVVGFADGCTAACAAAYANWTAGHGPAPTGKQSRDSWGTILRQTTGLGLFAKDDQPGHGPGTAPTAGATSSSGKGTPAPPLGLLVVTVGALALARRRRA